MQDPQIQAIGDINERSEYLRFDWYASTEKTHVFRVFAKTHVYTVLGHIKWYGAWRQYAFFPAEMTVFNPGCLEEISEATKALMEERKTRRKR